MPTLDEILEAAPDPRQPSALERAVTEAPVARQTITDYARRLQRGATSAFQTAPAQLAAMAGAPRTALEEAQRAEQSITERLSPAGRAVDASPVITPEGKLGPAWGQAILSSAIESAPSLIQSYAAGRPLFDLLGRAGVAERVGAAASRAGLGPRTAGVIGRAAEAAPFGLIEGVQAGATNAAQIGKTVREMPEADLVQAPGFTEALAGTDAALPQDQRLAAAREALASRAERQVLGMTTASTGGIGMLTSGGVIGQFARRLAGRQGAHAAEETLLRALGHGLGAEALQEGPQSGAEQLITNFVTRRLLNQNQSLSDDVLNQAVTGAAAGGLLGAVGGGAGYIARPRPHARAGEQAFEEPGAAPTEAAPELGPQLGGPGGGPAAAPIDAGGPASGQMGTEPLAAAAPLNPAVDPSAGPMSAAVAIGQASGAIDTNVIGGPVDAPPAQATPGQAPQASAADELDAQQAAQLEQMEEQARRQERRDSEADRIEKTAAAMTERLNKVVQSAEGADERGDTVARDQALALAASMRTRLKQLNSRLDRLTRSGAEGEAAAPVPQLDASAGAAPDLGPQPGRPGGPATASDPREAALNERLARSVAKSATLERALAQAPTEQQDRLRARMDDLVVEQDRIRKGTQRLAAARPAPEPLPIGSDNAATGRRPAGAALSGPGVGASVPAGQPADLGGGTAPAAPLAAGPGPAGVPEQERPAGAVRGAAGAAGQPLDRGGAGAVAPAPLEVAPAAGVQPAAAAAPPASPAAAPPQAPPAAAGVPAPAGRLDAIVAGAPAAVDAAAAGAATSPANDLPEPTAAMKEAGNYKKGHARIAGLDISVENEAGSRRRPEWPTMKAHYGYVRRTEGADGDHVDVFVRPGTPVDYDGPVFVVDQVKPDGSFDEHKAMIGWQKQGGAVASYRASYTRGWKVGPVTEVPMAEFKRWLAEGDTKRPFAGRTSPRAQAEGNAQRGGASEPEDFALTGNDRPVDEARARGQKELEPPAAPAPDQARGMASEPEPGVRFTLRQRRGGRNEAQLEIPLASPEGPDRAGTGQAAAARHLDATAALRVEPEPDATGTYRVRTELRAERTRDIPAGAVTTPAQAARALQHLGQYAVEHFDALVTDAAGRPLAIVGSFKGSLTQTSVYPSTVIQEAVRIPGAANLWFSHNHPSGAAELSNADRMLYGQLRELLRGTGIEPRGILAQTNPGAWVHSDGERGTVASKRAATASVPIMERVIVHDDQARPTVSGPVTARDLARETIEAGQRGPFAMLLDTRNGLVGVYPLTLADAAPLRPSGRVRRLWTAVSESNAAAVILVDPRATVPEGALRNINAALEAIDTRALDVMRGADLASWAEKGLDVADKAFFSREPRTEGMDVAAVRQVVAAVRKAWANGPEVEVVADINDPAVPQAVRDADAEQRASGGQGESKGVFHAGRMFLFARALSTEDDVVRVLMHEALGHYGLQGAFGEALNGVLDKVVDLRRAEVAAKMREYGLANTPQNRRLAAEEVLATLAQAQPQLPIVRGVIAAIRSWLRRIMPNLRLTNDEIIRDILIPAREFVRRDAAAQFRETERAYGGREGYDRAKAAGRTKLGYQQWIEARTARFIERFGDWQIAIAPARQASTFSEARTALGDALGRDLTNFSTGLVARVSRNSLDKMLNDKAVGKSESPALHALAVANIDALFENALRGWSKPDSGGDPNIAAVHRFFAPLNVNGRARLAKITVRELAGPTPNRLYSVESVEFNEKSPAAQWVAASAAADGIDLTSTRSARDVESLARRVQEFKPVDLTAAVDPTTGEPLASAIDAPDPAVQFRETERAYGGREGYDRAKAAGRTKLNYRQWVQIRTPAFKQWFGDWESAAKAKVSQGAPAEDLQGAATKESLLNRRVSGADANGVERSGSSDSGDVASVLRGLRERGPKVVDPATGEPMVVYHGTNKSEDGDAFRTFDTYGSNYGLMGMGGYFTESPEVASSYTKKGRGETPTVYPAYLSIKNPIDMDAIANPAEWIAQFDGIEDFHEDGDTNESWYRAAEDLLADQEVPMHEGAQTMQEGLRAMGYDGITHIGGGRASSGPQHRVWVAFDPEQIKSATGNAGAFDASSPDVRFSREPQGKTVGEIVQDAARPKRLALGGNMGQRASEVLRSLTVQDVARRLGNRLADLRGVALQTLGRRQLTEVYQGLLPAIAEYNAIAQQMDAEKNDSAAAADELARRWGRLSDERALADLMHDATLAGVDPAKDDVASRTHPDWAPLRRRWLALSEDARGVYVAARDMYAAHYAAVKREVAARIDRAMAGHPRRREMLERMEANLFGDVQGVYFPLARFGDYVIVAKNASGEVAAVSRAETLNEAETLRMRMMRALPASKGYTIGKVLKSREFNAARDAVGRGFLQELYGVLDAHGAAGAELQDAINQLYLSSLPDLSWAKHGMHRKGTPGFSQDARRAFAQNLFHGARYLAKLRHSDRLTDALTAMQEHVDEHAEDPAYDSIAGQQVVDEMVKRHEIFLNPKVHPLATLATSAGFVFYLGLSPASALVNLSQTPLVAYPVLGAKWGFRRAAAHLMAASRETMAAGNDLSSRLHGEELAAFKQAVADGTIDVTFAHDLGGIAQGEDAKVLWRMRPVMRAAAFMFHHAERFNRQVTFLAAYRMARQAGAPEALAYRQAVEATYASHFDYSACVDEATEILTTAGWKKRTELRVGDVAIATDAAGRAVESKVLAINVFEGEHEVIEFSSANRFSMVLTPNHDCVVQCYNSRDRKWQAPRKVRADALRKSHFIVRAPLAPLERDAGRLGEDFAALLGWIAAEGWYAKYRGCREAHDVRIGQSLTHNPEYVAEIRALLNRLGGEFKEYVQPRERDELVTFVLRRSLGRRVQEALPDKVLTGELLKLMSVAEMRAFIMAFLKGDGTKYEGGKAWAVGQKDGANLDLLQAMATMCGMRATLSPPNGNGIGALYVVPDDTGCRSHVRPLRQNRRTEPLVWCPTTEHGTWVARRNGAVFVTGNSNRPRVMQGNFARVVLLFKQFAQNMIYTLSRAAYLSWRGKGEEKAEARKALAALLTMHGLAAGALGLPIVGPLLTAASMLGSSDDEPWDAEVALRNYLAEAFGQRAGAALAHGLSRLTPWDISGRVGLDDLLFPDVREGLEGEEWAFAAAASAAGPALNMALIGPAKGLQLIGEGHWMRGLEAMLPAVLRSGVKSLRYATEGVMTRDGKTILDDVGVAEWLGQAAGFSPSRAREASEGREAVYNLDRRINARRATLMREFGEAIMKRDHDATGRYLEQVRAFNAAHPDRPITTEAISQSIRMRKMRAAEAERGVYLPRRRRGLLEEGAFADVE